MDSHLGSYFVDWHRSQTLEGLQGWLDKHHSIVYIKTPPNTSLAFVLPIHH